MKQYFVYILTNASGTLYIGITNSIEIRPGQHASGHGSRFTSRYRVRKLVHSESFANVVDALAREKQLKGWTRDRKIALIEVNNPGWIDLTINQRML